MTECCDPVGASPLDEASATRTADLFKVMADPVRLRLLSLIAQQPTREVCACDLVDVLGRSQPTISHHLKVLHAAGILGRERRGTWIHYSLSEDAVHDVEAAARLVFSVGQRV